MTSNLLHIIRLLKSGFSAGYLVSKSGYSEADVSLCLDIIAYFESSKAWGMK
jgi:hypothetical protein